MLAPVEGRAGNSMDHIYLEFSPRPFPCEGVSRLLLPTPSSSGEKHGPGLANYPNICPGQDQRTVNRETDCTSAKPGVPVSGSSSESPGEILFLMEHFRPIKQNSIRNSTFPSPRFHHQLMANFASSLPSSTAPPPSSFETNPLHYIIPPVTSSSRISKR